jgi:Co/Zn/Cd efflux system component
MRERAPVAHEHVHPPADDGVRTAFLVAVGLNAAFIVFEVVFGFRSGSLALLSDAGHNLGDVLGLLLAWGAILLARRAPSTRRTYGLRRSTILAALANAVVLLIAVGAIALEAVQRLQHPAQGGRAYGHRRGCARHPRQRCQRLASGAWPS